MAAGFVDNLKICFFSAFFPNLKFFLKGSHKLSSVVKEILEGVSQTLYYELFLKLKQVIDEEYHCQSSNTLEESYKYITDSYTFIFSTEEYIFKWIGLYYHMMTVAKMRKYHAEEEQMKRLVSHQVNLLLITI